MGRYYRQLEHRSSGYVLEVEPESWWDYWHQHMDFKGWGNLGWRHRRLHLRAHLQVMARMGLQLRQLPNPFQLWLWVDGEDAGQDAVYIHSPNPQSQFPVIFDGARWGGSAPNELGGIGDDLIWGRLDHGLVAFTLGVGVGLRG